MNSTRKTKMVNLTNLPTDFLRCFFSLKAAEISRGNDAYKSPRSFPKSNRLYQKISLRNNMKSVKLPATSRSSASEINGLTKISEGVLGSPSLLVCSSWTSCTAGSSGWLQCKMLLKELDKSMDKAELKLTYVDAATGDRWASILSRLNERRFEGAEIDMHIEKSCSKLNYVACQIQPSSTHYWKHTEDGEK